MSRFHQRLERSLKDVRVRKGHEEMGRELKRLLRRRRIQNIILWGVLIAGLILPLISLIIWIVDFIRHLF